MLWDRGTWTPAPGKDPRKSLAQGHLHFTADGERMQGEWILIRLSPRPGEKKNNWILRKVDDEHSGSPTGLTDKYLTSIKTGRTMQEIARGKKVKELAGWKHPPRYGEGDRARRGGGAGTESGAAPSPRRSESRSPSPYRGGLRLPAFREPQKATLVDQSRPGRAGSTK
jgi:bifunctional non-homologous end joining protein LigD